MLYLPDVAGDEGEAMDDEAAYGLEEEGAES